jgi:serine/threonine protein kinase
VELSEQRANLNFAHAPRENDAKKYLNALDVRAFLKPDISDSMPSSSAPPRMLAWVFASLCAVRFCAALAVRGRGGDALEAGAGQASVATPAVVCGLTAVGYRAGDFTGLGEELAQGGFGVVEAKTRSVAAGELLSPLEERVLAAADGTLAVKTALLNGGPSDVIARAKAMATKEAALGLLVCSGAACPPGSPFPAFLGLQSDTASAIPALVSERVQGVELKSLTTSKGAAAAAARFVWGEFLERHALPEATPPAPALRNLDGVLVVATQMALAVARLQELGIVHHDIKLANTMLDAEGGARVFDFGLACLGVTDAAVNAAAEPATPFSRAAAPCNRLACGGVSPGGTPGYKSPVKTGAFSSPCANSGACTAAELRSIDLFAVGASLLQLLTANHLSPYLQGALGEKVNTCATPASDDALKRYRERLAPALARYFSLDGRAGVNWSPTGAAAAAARQRMYSYLATVAADDSRGDTVLGAAPPMAFFRAGLPETNLRIPRCSPPGGMFGPAALSQAVLDHANAALTMAPAPGRPVPLPAAWSPGAVEPHLLPVPASPALAALLDALRKLLAFRPDDAYASALDAVRDLDHVRTLLAAEAAAPPAAADRIACLAAAAAPDAPLLLPDAPLPEPPLIAQARAQPRHTDAECRSAAALALEQIKQRDATPLAPGAAPQRPNAYDVAEALRACEVAHAAEAPPPRALLAQPAFAAVVRRHACARRRAVLRAPALAGQAPPAAAPVDAPAPAPAPAFEKTPFALASGGGWRERDFGWKCDVLGAGGLGVWVHWKGGNNGMGLVEEAFDSSDGATERACAKRWLRTPAGSNCKALRLRFASPRSKRGTNPREGLLKLYTATAEPADLLAGAITRFKAAHCGAGSILGDFRALLASAAAGAQPAGWEAAWSAAVAQRP